MPTLSAGNRSSERGVTLIELLVVVALIGLMAAISFPAVSSGLESLRLNSAATNVVSFFNSGLNRAERRQQVVEVTISKSENTITMRSTEPGFSRALPMPRGVTIAAVLPEIPDADAAAPRTFMLYPGGTAPQFAVQLINQKHAERVVRVDAMTGVPRIETPGP